MKKIYFLVISVILFLCGCSQNSQYVIEDQLLKEKDEVIGYCDENPECQYCGDLDEIVLNYFGLHGELVSKESIGCEQEYECIRVRMRYNPSAAESIEGEEADETIHYLITNYKDYLMDIRMVDENKSGDSVEQYLLDYIRKNL